MAEADSATPDQGPKTYTRVELADMVDRDLMTQAQADTLIDEQTVRRAEEAGRTAAVDAAEGSARNARVSEVIDRYVAIDADINVEGSPSRTKVEAAYKALVADGAPETTLTEKIALQQVFGPVETFEQLGANSAGETERETHHETGAGAGGSAGTQSRSGSEEVATGLTGAPGYMSADEKAYYADAIRSGAVASWDAAHKMMQRSHAGLRLSHGATEAVRASA
jgi:hypothetical protein|tara:strand:+ start:6255 stop:6926 length:672 start_codon:yes stop_codon:yes gene_type:complete